MGLNGMVEELQRHAQQAHDEEAHQSQQQVKFT